MHNSSFLVQRITFPETESPSSRSCSSQRLSSKVAFVSRKVLNHDGKKKDGQILHKVPTQILPLEAAPSNNPASCADMHVLDLASHPLQNALNHAPKPVQGLQRQLQVTHKTQDSTKKCRPEQNMKKLTGSKARNKRNTLPIASTCAFSKLL